MAISQPIYRASSSRINNQNGQAQQSGQLTIKEHVLKVNPSKNPAQQAGASTLHVIPKLNRPGHRASPLAKLAHLRIVKALLRLTHSSLITLTLYIPITNGNKYFLAIDYVLIDSLMLKPL